MSRYHIHKKKCIKCAVNYKGVHNQLYCPACRKTVYVVGGEFPELSTSTVGAIQELRVAVDLMRKGYDVFRALSPSASCDLFFIKEGKGHRVEVRTGYLNSAKALNFSKKKIRAELVAIVCDGKIEYRRNKNGKAIEIEGYNS